MEASVSFLVEIVEILLTGFEVRKKTQTSTHSLLLYARRVHEDQQVLLNQ
jgi:hypothetical protein